ncbi:hypothetical protein F5883DRAFT_125028 [Diaporthe sp. PMI_573]|nr:hypothetical protein F5883DRAFT_125028 [Diaporthaceae sp. PMI_573]
MELVRRERRRISVGQRGPCLADSVAFSYLYLFGRIVAVFPSVVLLFLALGSFKPVLEVYIIHFGLYSTLSGERLLWTRTWNDRGEWEIAAIIYDTVVLGLLGGTVPLALRSPTVAKVLVLLTIFSCRMWSAWECFALLRECRKKIQCSPVDNRWLRFWLVFTLVVNLLLLLVVWFTLPINHHGWFSLVAYFLCVPVEANMYLRQIWTLYLRPIWIRTRRRDESLEETGRSELRTSLQSTVDVPPAVHGRPSSGWDWD